jgi:hypothetical protein
MRASWDAPAKQDFSQNDRVVMSLIMRRKNECNSSSLGESTQLAEPVGMLMYLLRVAASKLVPASGIMPEPPPQRSAGCDVLGPQINRSIHFLDPAGPKTVDQYSSAVIGASGIVCSL